MGVKPISIDKAKEIAKKKGLKPGKVRGTEKAVQLTKGRRDNIEVISWDEFEDILSKGHLVLCEESGWMRIMRR
jgi:hypothetical protein